jgi:6-oxo-cyclohex-1-ene-carbonyl-CoA hydrolase
MSLKWLRRDNELKDHTLLGEEHFGAEATSVIYEKLPIFAADGGMTIH